MGPIVFGLVVVQVSSASWAMNFLSGALHGLNAMALFGVALYAGRRLRAAAPAAVGEEQAHAATPV